MTLFRGKFENLRRKMIKQNLISYLKESSMFDALVLQILKFFYRITIS